MRVLTLIIGAVVSFAACSPMSMPPRPQVSVEQAKAAYQGELTPDLMHALLLADMAFKRNELNIAVDNYAFVAKVTQDAEIAERATRVAFYAKRYKVALEAAQIWEQQSPETREIPQIMAMLHFRSGDIDSSLTYWRKILNSNGHTAEQIFLQVSRVLANEADKEAVLRLMQALVAEYEQLPHAHLAYARLALEANDFPLAHAELNRTLQLKPHWWRANVLRAQTYSKEDKWQEAEDSLAQAVNSRPKDAELRLRYDRLLFERGSYHKAKKQFSILQ
ncbi:MAG: tetratricopeptide repeat protein, partial [Gammaproteobacteria bacterium]|nr:tetratricopeptide repeat protein [Gammaproteobacteria bacterium]